MSGDPQGPPRACELDIQFTCSLVTGDFSTPLARWAGESRLNTPSARRFPLCLFESGRRACSAWLAGCTRGFPMIGLMWSGTPAIRMRIQRVASACPACESSRVRSQLPGAARSTILFITSGVAARKWEQASRAGPDAEGIPRRGLARWRMEGQTGRPERGACGCLLAAAFLLCTQGSAHAWSLAALQSFRTTATEATVKGMRL